MQLVPYYGEEPLVTTTVEIRINPEDRKRSRALLAGTAFVGAYTTFSTWMLETQRLGEERQTRAAVANIVISVVLGMAAALLGQWVADQI